MLTCHFLWMRWSFGTQTEAGCQVPEGDTHRGEQTMSAEEERGVVMRRSGMGREERDREG